ncbi:MAG: hypothetical protein ACR2N3_14290 [Pyrinomonadaceae bacterium]
MAQPSNQQQPPKLEKTESGDININSLANLLEWFLSYDGRVGVMRHPHVQELFEWKQADDAANGVQVYPFENAEARFAVGVFSAIAENDSEAKLALWMTDVLQALGESKQTVEDFAAQYKLETKQGASPVMESQKLPSKTERRIFLTFAWIESLSTAEIRFLGWVYQELYGKSFQPITES